MIDLSFLEKFTKGNPSKMKRYIQMYLESAPGAFVQMNENIQNKNWDSLGINAHSLKPLADYMGITGLKEALTEIEGLVKKKEVSDIKKIYDKAYQLHKEGELLLKKELGRL